MFWGESLNTTGLTNLVQVKSITDDQWGIEGIYSQSFSVGIFVFLIICIIVFTVIVIKFMQSGGGKAVNGQGPAKGMKKGEKIMFLWIFIGIGAAVVMAVMQLLQGYLF